MTLNGATFDYRGRNLPGPTGNTTEFVTNVVYSGNSRILLTSLNLQTNTLVVSNLTRQGNGVLLVGRTTGLLGVNNRFLVGNPASIPTNNNMVAPYILNTTDQTFLNYIPDTFDTLPVGFT